METTGKKKKKKPGHDLTARLLFLLCYTIILVWYMKVYLKTITVEILRKLYTIAFYNVGHYLTFLLRKI